MSQFDRTRLITPPREEEEVYPYRRVWRSLFIESTLWFGLLVILFILRELLGFTTSGNTRLFINIMLTLTPTFAWFTFSRLFEGFVPQPRKRLLTTFVVSALVANAIGLPAVTHLLRPDDWLALQPTLNRILGYTLTIGVLHEFLKYLVLRYLVWVDYFRNQFDIIAYAIAAAMGYALVLNLNQLIINPDSFHDQLFLRVVATTSIHIASSIILAYGLSQTIFRQAISIALPLALVMSSLLAGVAIPMRTAFMRASVSLGASSANSLFGIAFTLFIYGVAIAITFFLFDVTERREQNRFASEAI